MTGKFMGHNPFSGEKGYVPNFPDRVPGIPVFQTGRVSIDNLGSRIAPVFKKVLTELDI